MKDEKDEYDNIGFIPQMPNVPPLKDINETEVIDASNYSYISSSDIKNGIILKGALLVVEPESLNDIFYIRFETVDGKKYIWKYKEQTKRDVELIQIKKILSYILPTQ